MLMKVFLFFCFPKILVKEKNCDKTNLLRFGGEKIFQNGLEHLAPPWMAGSHGVIIASLGNQGLLWEKDKKWGRGGHGASESWRKELFLQG